MIDKEQYVIKPDEIQSMYPALDAGIGDDEQSIKMEEARMSHIAAPVQAILLQGLNTQIKSWTSSLNISRKQVMELLRMNRDEHGRESEIVRSIKDNFMTPKVAGIVEGQLQGRIVVPTSEPYIGSMNSVKEDFKLMIDVPKKSDWSTPKP